MHLIKKIFDRIMDPLFDSVFGKVKEEYVKVEQCVEEWKEEKGEEQEKEQAVVFKCEEEEKIEQVKREGPLPSFCLLVVNKQCNFRCRMCNMWKSLPNPHTLTLDEMKAFVVDLRSFVDEDIFIHLIGGETLLWPHTPEIARFITDKGFRTSITTNGYLIDAAMAKRLVDAKVSGIFLSLDSLNEEKHDYIRGVRGSHKHVMDAVDHLYDYIIKTKADTSIGHTFTIMEHNIGEVLDFADWAEKNSKIDSVFFNAVLQPFDCGEENQGWIKDEKYKEIWPRDTEKIDRILDGLIERKEKGYKICNPARQITVLKEYFKDPYHFRQNMKIKCPRGELSLEINADGDIAMCFFMEPLGNIRKDKVSDVWYSEKMKKVRDEINHCDKDCDIVVNCFYKVENLISDE